jgi:hypothetical protein
VRAGIALACLGLLILAGCSGFPPQALDGVEGYEIRTPKLSAGQPGPEPVPQRISGSARVAMLKNYLTDLGGKFQPMSQTSSRPDLSCMGFPNKRFYLALDGSQLHVSFGDKGMYTTVLSDFQRSELYRVLGQAQNGDGEGKP